MTELTQRRQDPVPAPRSEPRLLLDFIVAPHTVAVIGATETVGRVGRSIFWNSINGPFAGRVFPVNPRRRTAFGVDAYSRFGLVPDPVDLAVVVTPAITTCRFICSTACLNIVSTRSAP